MELFGVLLVCAGSIKPEQSILWPIFGFSFSFSWKGIVCLGFNVRKYIVLLRAQFVLVMKLKNNLAYMSRIPGGRLLGIFRAQVENDLSLTPSIPETLMF